MDAGPETAKIRRSQAKIGQGGVKIEGYEAA